MPRQKEATARLLICKVCAGPLRQSGARIAFCGDSCRKQSAREYQRNRDLAATSHRRFDRQCKECESTFMPSYGNKRRFFCTEICSRKHKKRIERSKRRAKIRSVKIETVDPIKVFNRDGWKCHICAGATPKKYRGTYRATAPELDHIVPLSLGGAHSYSNTACCCRKCNQRKGAQVFGQPSLLAA